MKKRVVVTGMGVISPIGNTVEEFWQSLKAKRVGIGEITHYDASEDKVKLAAEVKDFNPKNYMDPKAARRMELFSQYAVAAAYEAIGNAGLDLEKEDRTRIGVSVGCGIGSLQIMEQALEKRYTKGFKKMPPLFVPMMITNMAAGNVAISFGLEGTCVNVVTACATGTHSIGEAFRAIQWGDADVMIAGGTEAAICPTGIGGFHALTAVSTSQDPAHASMPFDKNRSGFVMGEGAGVVVLESLEHAKARGAQILAEVGGFGSTCDAYHITSPKEDGSGAARAMLLAAQEAGLTGKDIQYVNAHGTGTHHNDLFETRAIKKAFGEDAYQMNVNSTKSMTGHMLGAAGAVEFIACVKTVMEDFIHATAGFEEAEEEMDLNYTKEAVSRKVTAAITNSLGFGGHNGSLLVKKYAE
ncbi:MAG TPA: beta-ketoacyl-ACP synthase II [Candidatus Choladousia intestinigallinarum]|nr:beta-ketoacyl-ACP synthase II [Candidatus Choladousia intestinigallinarum]